MDSQNPVEMVKMQRFSFSPNGPLIFTVLYGHYQLIHSSIHLCIHQSMTQYSLTSEGISAAAAAAAASHDVIIPFHTER
jgi:hypothetical protein